MNDERMHMNVDTLSSLEGKREERCEGVEWWSGGVVAVGC